MIVSMNRVKPCLVIVTIFSMTDVSAAAQKNSDDDVTQPTIQLPSFFDLKQEIENIFPSARSDLVTDDYILEPGVTLERDYDFYDDDIDNEPGDDDDALDTSESAAITVRSSFFPQAAASSRADDRSDYEYYDDYSASHRDYGHSYGHDDHHSSGYGHDDHGSYGGGHGHGGYGGYKVQPKKPGPYGYPSPNFKCEKSSETLYVTETEMTYDKKCYNIYKTKCQDGYDEGKGIGYQKHCNEFTVTRCRTVFDTSSEERCWTVYKKQCDMIYETVVDYEYEQKCSVSYEEECHGYGYHQECEKVPKEHCKQIPKKVEKSVPRTKCKKVPDKRCQDFPINVPRKECKEFPKTVCTQDPVNVKKKIPKKICVSIPKEVCNTIPRIIVKEVPKKVGKKVCHSTKVDYGHHSSSYHEPSYHSESSYTSGPDYKESSNTYTAPSSNTYTAPPKQSSSYKAPPTDYKAPAAPSSYSAPDEYGAPQSPPVSPTNSYGTQAANNYGYKRLASQRRYSGYSHDSVQDNWALGPG